MKKLIAKRETTLILAILIVAVVTTVINPQFLTFSNLINIISTNAANAIMAVGMTLVLIVGGIDISVSAQLVTVGVLAGKLMQMGVLNIVTMFLAFFLIGGLLGAVNGTLVAKTNLPPIIVSLAMMNIFRGFILDWTRGSWLMGLPKYFLNLGTGKLFGIPVSIYVLAVVTVVMHLVLRYTRIGRQIYAVGGNKTSAMRMGVSLSKVYIFVFASLGALTGIAAIVYFSPSGAILPTAASGLEMTIVASVVLGGTSIYGGKGNVLSTLLGILLLGLIQNALVLAHVQAYWQNILNGICIVIPVVIDAVNTKRELGEYKMPHFLRGRRAESTR